MKNLIEKFYTTDSTGKCTDNSLEFGNMYRKIIICAFCDSESGECHYSGDCDRKNLENKNLGWRTN